MKIAQTKSKILVTKSFLPPQKEYQAYLNRIWDSNQLTNQGTLVRELEIKLKQFLKIKYVHFVANGTIALQIALNALDITKGEIITTPFSYVATISSILWERCKPVFVDIDPNTLCIDPSKIERKITKKTRAIMAVHVFGYPCDIDVIGRIAKRHNLQTIYDGAHAFGTIYKDKSLLSYGDISTCSFHATKLFHTGEGGCVLTNNKTVSDKIELIKRFGHNFDTHIRLGINAKSSELHAAMGLSNLKYVKNIIQSRSSLCSIYDSLLKNKFQRPLVPNNFIYNFAYYPIILNSKEITESIIKKLNAHTIFPRRYFYPSLNTLIYLKNKQSCPVSEVIAERILCLPLYHDLRKKDIERICKIILNSL